VIVSSLAPVSTTWAQEGATLVGVSDTTAHPDERALAARVADDIEAFAALYRHYLPRVHAFAYRRTGSVEAAEDICSATFESALGSIGSFRPDSGGFAPWIFRIASRQTIAHYRRESRARSDRGQEAMARLAPSDVAPVEDSAVVGEGTLRQALDQLNPRYQQAIALRHLAGLDVGEAAAAMGLAKPAFSVVLSRATAALRKQLDRIEGGA